MPISSKRIEPSGAPSTGIGQYHSQGIMQNSSTNFSAVCFSSKMALDLGGDFVLLINLDRIHCSCVYKQSEIMEDLPQLCIGQVLGWDENRELSHICLC